jgi:uracil-DNA glycosylase
MDINFTKVCKYIIENRKRFRECSNNCKEILFKQIDCFDCDIVLPIGQYSTETILRTRVNKLKDVVGKNMKLISEIV